MANAERTRTIAKWRRYNRRRIDALFHWLPALRRHSGQEAVLKSLPLNDGQFRIAVGIVGVILVLLIVRIRFCYDLDLPATPAPPPSMTNAEALETTRSLDYSPETYRQSLRDDSNTHGVKPVATEDSMSRVFPYQRKVIKKKILPGDPAVAASGLKLRLIVQDIRGTHKRQMVLEIENVTSSPIAYRVVTRPSKGTKPCRSKRDLAHNALAIAPASTELRSECTYRKGWGLEIQSVETIQLPELAYIYVSWLRPERIGIDRRTGAGHRTIGASKPCEVRLAANIEQALETEEISWRDVIDFYARHRCRTYSFPYGYKAFTRPGEYSLPAARESL